MERERIIAKWIDSQYVASPVGGPEEWYSIDGDEWIDEHGDAAASQRFEEATIILSGGARDGEEVS